MTRFLRLGPGIGIVSPKASMTRFPPVWLTVSGDMTRSLRSARGIGIVSPKAGDRVPQARGSCPPRN